MRSFSIIALLLWVAVSATAQNEADIQRYTNLQIPGTARFASLGGAFTALGGDMSAMHINPASIGVFRFNELSFTPLIETTTVNTSLYGTSSSGSNTGFAVANAGLVLVSEVDDPYWRSVNIGFSINRLNTFNDELVSQGAVPLQNSLMQSFLNEAEGFTLDQLNNFGAGPAYDASVINLVNDASYVGRVTEGEMNQSQVTRRSGRMNDFAITVGGNYDDKLYVGAGVGFVSSYYEVRNEITESPTLPITTDLVRYRYSEDLVVEGFGLNLSLGFIYKTASGFRVGGSIQTPTTLRLQDVYRTDVQSFFRDPDETLDSSTNEDFLEYRIRTPWRYSLGVAGVINSKAILTAQYEFVNFSGGRFLPANRRSGNISPNMEFANDLVIEEFRAQHIFRGGIEFRLTKSLMARGGVAYFPNVIPFNEQSINGNLNRIQLGGGVGYRKAAWNLDLSYTHARVHEPYLASGAGPVQELRNTFGMLSLTLGIRL
jgi:hypothetical protein